jgi:hypothetical protein
MSYQLIPPGARKNNPFWVVRYRDPFTGKSTEYSTKKSDKKAAERVAVNFWHRLLQSGPPQPGEKLNFEKAARLYAAFKGIYLDLDKHPDAKRTNRLIGELGSTLLADINHSRLVTAANNLCPDLKAATKNREVMRVAAAVLHYAAKNNGCEWLRIEMFTEPEPETRAVSGRAIWFPRTAPTGSERPLIRRGTKSSRCLTAPRLFI